ncbi:MAG: DMT family transporter [Planctomycetes bacterium]|nr:DMT family transporter [Planctomycetota bacterium]
MRMLAFVALAAVLGLCVALQGATNGALASRIGLPAAVLLNAVVVVVAAFVWWLLAARGAQAALPSSWLLYLGGVYGLVIIALAAFLFPRFGAGSTMAVMVAAQLVMVLVLDHIGWPGQAVPVTVPRLCGAGLLVLGAVLVLWPRLAGGR